MLLSRNSKQRLNAGDDATHRHVNERARVCDTGNIGNVALKVPAILSQCNNDYSTATVLMPFG
jgi:hypothetical protein